jgi:hypothetical protein
MRAAYGSQSGLWQAVAERELRNTLCDSMLTKYLKKPHLLPKYDDPEFRNIHHLFAGWSDGNPAHLKPAKSTELAVELASLVDGADTLAQRAAALAERGQTRLATYLAQLAGTAAPHDKNIRAIRASVFERCRATETSLIGKALFALYQREAKAQSSS